MGKKYNFQGYEKDSVVRVVGKDLTISTKKSIEVCNAIRNKHLEVAKNILEDCLDLRQAIPFKRFTNGVGHRKGPMAAGAYPEKVAEAVLGLVESLETNAQQKGFNTSNLVVVHAVANKGTTPYKMSRHRGRLTKNTHIELVALEKKEVREEKKEKNTPAKKEEKKEEANVEEKKPEAPKKEEKEKVQQKTKEEKKQEVPDTEEKKEAPHVPKEKKAEEGKTA